MSEAENQKILHLWRSAVASDLRLLMRFHDRETDLEWLETLKEQDFPHNLGLKLQSEIGITCCDLMRQAIKALPTTIDSNYLENLAADFAAIYLNHRLQASPCESVWIDEEGLMHQEAMFQVRQWYQQYELAAENWRIRPDDHLVLQLAFIAHLFELDTKIETLQQAAQFLDEHLLRWINDFAKRVAAHCNTDYYAGINLLTAQYLEELRDILAELLAKPRPTAKEIEKRLRPQKTIEPVPMQYVPGTGPSW
ncbi:MAG: dehydrogenase [Candidatus Parabeggiatoa sp. nov. 3]|nr:MAG: dehydrogenase [Gammaproteobacteria bacterium]RKZ61717.1 MAG: dehydrogenase [Gammaproteobacteria bacterium]RKZ78394.1 MAG: dehydrogenase [Gammaproteobacteria bacterium]